MRAQLAVLFPGQGSQTPDMCARVARVRPDLLAAARQAVGGDPFPRVDESTRFAQPALFCAALAGWHELQAIERPAFLAGHSLGEIAALAAAGSIAEHDALRVVTERGRLMDDAAARDGAGGMLAVLGTGARTAAKDVAAALALTVANDNAPSQVVLSGAGASLDEASRELEAAGLRVRSLPVAGAFHSPVMQSVVAPFRAVLDEIEVRQPRLPVLSCVSAAPFEDVRDQLARAITAPVRWLEVVEHLHARGVRRFVETGPGRILTGLVRGTLSGVEAVHA